MKLNEIKRLKFREVKAAGQNTKGRTKGEKKLEKYAQEFI